MFALDNALYNDAVDTEKQTADRYSINLRQKNLGQRFNPILARFFAEELAGSACSFTVQGENLLSYSVVTE